ITGLKVGVSSQSRHPVYVSSGFRVMVRPQDSVVPVEAVDVALGHLALDAHDPLPDLVVRADLTTKEDAVEFIAVDSPLRKVEIIGLKDPRVGRAPAPAPVAPDIEGR